MDKTYPTLTRIPAHLVASRVHLAILKKKKWLRAANYSDAWTLRELKSWLSNRVLRTLKCAAGNDNAATAHWAFQCALEAIRD